MDGATPVINVEITKDQESRLRTMPLSELAQIFGFSTEVIKMMGRDSFLATVSYTVKEEAQ